MTTPRVGNITVPRNIRVAPSAFGITPEHIRRAMSHPRTPSGTTAAFRDVSRNINQIVANQLRQTVHDDAEAIRRAIDERGISVTGHLRQNIRARGTGRWRQGDPVGEASTRRLIDLEYPDYLEYISYGTGPQRFPPARKAQGQTIMGINKDNWDDYSPQPYQGQYGLLDWIELKGLTSEKYDNAWDLYRAIGGSIKWNGIQGKYTRGILDESQREVGSLGRALFQREGAIQQIGEEWLGLAETFQLRERNREAAKRAAEQMFEVFVSFYTGPSRDKVEELRNSPYVSRVLDRMVQDVDTAYNRAAALRGQ